MITRLVNHIPETPGREYIGESDFCELWSQSLGCGYTFDMRVKAHGYG